MFLDYVPIDPRRMIKIYIVLLEEDEAEVKNIESDKEMYEEVDERELAKV